HEIRAGAQSHSQRLWTGLPGNFEAAPVAQFRLPGSNLALSGRRQALAAVRTYRVGATRRDDALPGIGLQTRQQVQLFKPGVHLPGTGDREGFGAALSNLYAAKHSHAIGDDAHLLQPDAACLGEGSLE